MYLTATLLFVVGAVAALVAFANTDYNTGVGPAWTKYVFAAGLVSAAAGVLTAAYAVGTDVLAWLT